MAFAGIAFFIFFVVKFIDNYPEKDQPTDIDTNQKYLPYKKRYSIMTNAEKKYFLYLQEKYGQAYYIFPQVNLDKIIEVTDQKNFYTYFNKINRKSVDFVLANKETLETFKAVELDDYTHNWNSRKKRDAFVNEIFESIDLLLSREK